MARSLGDVDLQPRARRYPARVEARFRDAKSGSVVRAIGAPTDPFDQPASRWSSFAGHDHDHQLPTVDHDLSGMGGELVWAQLSDCTAGPPSSNSGCNVARGASGRSHHPLLGLARRALVGGCHLPHQRPAAAKCRRHLVRGCTSHAHDRLRWLSAFDFWTEWTRRERRRLVLHRAARGPV